MIIHGDSMQRMKLLPENSVDAVVTDPPYGLSFMGKKWDYDVPSVDLWKEVMRVLKPGGFLLSFAGTRTYHRMAVNIEDAGFEIRDMISWLYGSGFPKSLNIGKQIDKIKGNERGVVETNETIPDIRADNYSNSQGKERLKANITKGNSEWEGWGTALKPACEPIVVARKPLSEKNVALNVLKWGTGGINIDECRVGDELRKNSQAGFIRRGRTDEEVFGSVDKNKPKEELEVNGRFPANIILDEEAGEILDEQSGSLKSGFMKKGTPRLMSDNPNKNTYGEWKPDKVENDTYGDKGGASRFFYCAKASKSERNLGCEKLDEKLRSTNNKIMGDPGSFKTGSGNERNGLNKNNHPTVKPIKLMEYLVKLVSREGATVLDPFLGSGTTAIACIKLNRKWIGIEDEEDYIKIIHARIKPFMDQTTHNIEEVKE